ncbi:MAG: MBL fold metallo-hydrolase [Bacteroidales bacterium]|nr:MBL fold metallo-hydrolase [Bacteroidales bacterium]
MIKQFTFNHYEVNCYVVADAATRQCAIVDPACEASFEDSQLLQYIDGEGLKVARVLLTHGHVDHIAGLRQVCGHFGLPVSMHGEGRKLLRQAEAYGAIMGFAVDNMDDLDVEELEDGQVLHVGDIEMECRFVPGHCPGSLCFVVPKDKVVITGDALFHYSIGRTDLPGGSYPLLVEKIRSRILTLPDDFRVLPGHGIESLVGKERKYNSFLQ